MDVDQSLHIVCKLLNLLFSLLLITIKIFLVFMFILEQVHIKGHNRSNKQYETT